MQNTLPLPLEVSVRRTTLGAPEQAMIRRCVERLTGDFDHLLGCRLEVDAPPPQRGEHPTFTAQVELTVPGGVLTVVQPASPDRFSVIQEALDAAARQLEEYALQQRHHAAARSEPTYH